jgi:HEAT repeat protein
MHPYLKCFKDDHVSVRDHACRTTYKLQLRDETIRNLLIECIEYDPVEKVRYSAVEALGLYGMTNEKCQNVLLWTVRYDKSPLVRAAAPNALVLLEKSSEDIIDTLQSRFLVEKEPIVIQ